ncbi:helix-turn-helix transcriptional regulator [bacterium]|nr:helix-turn-helix transcriptional regulator [bacterium]
MEYRSFIASKIVKARKAVGLKQEELAHLIGVSVTSTNLWENGKQMPRLENLIIISQITNKPLHWFFWDENSESQKTREEIFILTVYKNLNRRGKMHMLEFIDNLRFVDKYREVCSVK